MNTAPGEAGVPLPGDPGPLILEPPTVIQIEKVDSSGFRRFVETQGNPVAAYVIEKTQREEFDAAVELAQMKSGTSSDTDPISRLFALEDTAAVPARAEAAFAVRAVAWADAEIERLDAEIEVLEQRKRKWEAKVAELRK